MQEEPRAQNDTDTWRLLEKIDRTREELIDGIADLSTKVDRLVENRAQDATLLAQHILTAGHEGTIREIKDLKDDIDAVRTLHSILAKQIGLVASAFVLVLLPVAFFVFNMLRK